MRISDTRAALAVLAVAAAAFAALPARAADNVAPAIAGVGGSPIPRGSGRWQASLGVRNSFLRDPGYDPFSSNDVLTQLSVAVTHAFEAGPGLVPAVGLVWDTGEASGSARGVDTGLGLMRLALALEAHFMPARGAFLMVRAAPGFQRASVSLRDPSAPAPLETTYWTASVDASAGGGVRVTPSGSPIGFWLLADGGYGWAPAHDLVLTPALPKQDAQKAGTTTLGSLSTRGAFFRLALALSY